VSPHSPVDKDTAIDTLIVTTPSAKIMGACLAQVADEASENNAMPWAVTLGNLVDYWISKKSSLGELFNLTPEQQMPLKEDSRFPLFRGYEHWISIVKGMALEVYAARIFQSTECGVLYRNGYFKGSREVHGRHYQECDIALACGIEEYGSFLHKLKDTPGISVLPSCHSPKAFSHKMTNQGVQYSKNHGRLRFAYSM
jgi:hypothetical protein